MTTKWQKRHQSAIKSENFSRISMLAVPKIFMEIFHEKSAHNWSKHWTWGNNLTKKSQKHRNQTKETPQHHHHLKSCKENGKHSPNIYFPFILHRFAQKAVAKTKQAEYSYFLHSCLSMFLCLFNLFTPHLIL